MKYRVRHITEIRYDGLVNLARFNLRLKPVDWPGQILLERRLSVVPPHKIMTEERGPFVVNVERLTLDQPTSSLTVTSDFTVRVDRTPPVLSDPSPTLNAVRQQALEHRGVSAYDPASYLFGSPMARMTPEIAAWAAAFLPDGGSILPAAAALMHAIHDQCVYDSKATDVNTPALTAFLARRGVCQDFAHIMIIALRHFGIPAAYVSGYLRTLPPPGQAKLIGADATHAWVNVWCGEALGWVGFDPTNAVLIGNDHIFMAMGRDFGDVSPLDGVFIGGGGQRMKVSVEVAESAA